MLTKRISGLTLASIMVAVGLSGVLAVAGVRLVVNQMNSSRVMELVDKGDAIYKFYSNMLHDDKVWWCTLYDGIEQGAAGNRNNKALRECVTGNAGSCFSGAAGKAMQLMGPDCKFKEPRVPGPVKHRFKHDGLKIGGFDFTRRYGSEDQFSSSRVVLIPDGGKDLKDSVMTAASGGWWNVEIRWREMGGGAVDLIYKQKFNADRWRSAPSAGKRHLPQLNYPRELRIRRSTNYVTNTCGGNKAVTRIALHTANRDTTCGDPLVNIAAPGAECPTAGGVFGGVVRATDGGVVKCSSNPSSGSARVSVTPTDCGEHHSVIWQIGYGGAADRNVVCALNGSGKMVNYGGSGVPEKDKCPAKYANPAIESDPAPGSMAIDRIDDIGNTEYTTLHGFPASKPDITRTVPHTSTTHTFEAQGPIGGDGINGTGPPGVRGPPCGDPALL